jgi:hypothetical protein
MTPWKILRTVSLVAIFAALPMLRLPAVASAQTEGPVTLRGNKSVHDERVEMLREEFRERQRENREVAERVKEFKKGRRAHGRKAEPAIIGSEDRASAAARAARVAQTTGSQNVFVTPTNTQANNKTGDVAGAGQAEQSIAFLGQNGLCAWNDGQGFSVPPDVQGFGWTVDGGATWTDGGVPLKGGTMTAWTSDPVVSVNEKTGEFYYCGLTSNTVAGVASNGVAVARGHFQAGTFVWDGVSQVAVGPNASNSFDKQWVAADSLTGNVYVSWTLFIVGGNNIWTARSTDGGATWGAPGQINGTWELGLVQGSRPVVGPNGEVYIAYSSIGPVDADSMKIAKSVNNGVSYSPAVCAMPYFDNFFNGAPGFNRPRAVTFQSTAADRSTGPNRGRLYMTAQDCVDIFADNFFINSGVSEVEANSGFANATPFTIGQTVRGSISSTADQDWFRFPAVQGTTYLFWADSVRSASFRYTLRIYCPNDTLLLSRLAFSGAQATNSAQNSHSFIAWTCPATNNYYLRMVPVTVGSGANGYRIVTTTHTPVAQDVARDQRDIVVATSNDGVTWNPRTLVNDDPALYDNWLPEVVVPCEGNPYIMWFDFRDAAASCNGGTNVYVTRSTNAGATWATSQVATTAPTPNWTQVSSNIAPNQGDYNGMYGGDCVALAMADGRLGDPDVQTARILTEASITGCPSGQVVLAGTTFNGSATANNPNQLFANTYTYSVTIDRSWPGMPASGSVGVSSQGSSPVPISIAVPDTAADGEVVHVCVSISNNGACVETCCFDLAVLNGATATLASLISSSAQPGHVSLAWQLSQSAMVNVYRATTATNWVQISRQPTGSDGMVKFQDNDAQAGTRYGYRLGIPVSGSEQFAGETWVEVPVNVEFAIRSVFPNPATAGFAVQFSLRSSAKATLELFDLSGRRVVSREVGSLGAGSHVFTLSRDARLPVGIYQLRLTQGSQVAKASVSIIR